MSNGALDKPTFEDIEAYVLDRMAAGERDAFELRLAAEPPLRDEVAMQRENILAIELGGVERELKAIAAEHRSGSQSGPDWSRYLKYAAVIALLASAAVYWINRPSPNERLFAESFTADPGLPVTMGTTDATTFTDAMVHYKEGHYAQAAEAWSKLLQQDLKNDTLRFYLGTSLLANNEATRAIEQLIPVAYDARSAFNTKARWYLFLAFVRTGDRQRAEAVRFGSGDAHREAAQRILSEWPR